MKRLFKIVRNFLQKEWFLVVIVLVIFIIVVLFETL